jgi:hypothetical protein
MVNVQQAMRGLRGGGGNWVRDIEHIVLRVLSLAFSLASADAIRLFYSPLNGGDVLQMAVPWVVAVSFGVSGYFLSRGLAHRLMNKENIAWYLPICLVVEFVEILANYALAVSVMQHATWLQAVPPDQRHVLMILAYIGYSIIPAVSVFLAVVDMDLDRKRGGGSHGRSGVASPWGGARPAQPKPSPTNVFPGGNGYQGYQAQSKGAQNGPVPLGAQTN